jgi:hypothetical protein
MKGAIKLTMNIISLEYTLHDLFYCCLQYQTWWVGGEGGGVNFCSQNNTNPI